MGSQVKVLIIGAEMIVPSIEQFVKWWVVRCYLDTTDISSCADYKEKHRCQILFFGVAILGAISRIKLFFPSKCWGGGLLEADGGKATVVTILFFLGASFLDCLAALTKRDYATHIKDCICDNERSGAAALNSQFLVTNNGDPRYIDAIQQCINSVNTDYWDGRVSPADKLQERGYFYAVATAVVLAYTIYTYCYVKTQVLKKDLCDFDVVTPVTIGRGGVQLARNIA